MTTAIAEINLVLLYDVIILSLITVDLQGIMQVSSTYCLQESLVINYQKSKILAFPKI